MCLLSLSYLHFLEFYVNGIIEYVLYYFSVLYLMFPLGSLLLLTGHPGWSERRVQTDAFTHSGSVCGSANGEQDGIHSEFSNVQFF